MNTAPVQPIYVNQQEAARLLSTTPVQLRRWHAAGVLPQPSRIGGVVRYSVDELKAFMARHRSNDGE